MANAGKTIENSAFTGERVIPGCVEADLWNEHVSRYQFAATFAARKSVLDVGCGTGYGTALLAAEGGEAAGFDISREAIDYALHHYPGMRFVVGSANAFPARDSSFDVVVAFEVIEHIPDWQTLIQEAERVLKPGGVFLVSTPNKAYYSEAREAAGPNPFHVHEFELRDFEEALSGVFPFVRILAQNQQEAIVFAGEQTGQRGLGFVASGPVLAECHFFLAVCAKQPIEMPSFSYAPSSANLLREREHYIRSLRAEQASLLGEYRRLEQEFEQQNRWALSLDGELANARVKLDDVHRELEDRTVWAKSLDAELQRTQERLSHLRSALWVRFGRKLGFIPKPRDSSSV